MAAGGNGFVASFVCGIAFRYVRQVPARRRGTHAPDASDFTWRERLMVGALGPRGTTSIVFGLLAFNALPDGVDADTALYAMTITVLGSVLLHGVGSLFIARLLAGRRR
ncbi:hypothetical protein [Streptomyces eurythermus]|uniref:hypothetical protein n=1 Tax=Streptomyces eurythermus TaxID=42237 RepID=UPI0036FF94F8